MTSLTRLYFCACIHLYAVLSAEYCLFETEDIRPPGGVIPLGRFGSPEFGSLLEWALHESLESWSEAGNDLDPELISDAFLAQWVPMIWNAARSAHSMVSEIEKGRWTQYFYYGSLMRVLNAFDEIFHDPQMLSSRFSARYQEHVIELNVLGAKLAADAPTPQNDGYDMVEKNTIAQHAETLAHEWLTAVRNLAGGE